jgi:hypothetical protein
VAISPDVPDPGHTPAIAPDPMLTPEEQALHAAANAGLTLTPPTTAHTPDIIEIDNDDTSFQAFTPPPIPTTYIKLEPPTVPIAEIPLDPMATLPVVPPAPHPPTSPAVRRSGHARRPNSTLADFNTTFATFDAPITICDTDDDDDAPDALVRIYHYLMVHYASTPPDTKQKQFGLKAGLRRFGERGEDAVTKELTQLNTYNTFTPLDASSLTPTQCQNALSSFIFLTKKWTGDIKARACADGRKHHEHIAKDKTTSPTVSNDSTFALAAIAAHEGRTVATLELPGAFLHAEEAGGTNGQDRANNLPIVHYRRSYWPPHPLRPTTKGTLWSVEERASFLSQAILRPCRPGFYHQSIRSLHCEQTSQ